MSPRVVRIGSRHSPLARWQAGWVTEELNRRGVATEIVYISTTADRHLSSIAELGVTGVFTREIQQALLDNTVDVAVHSLKDLPTEPVAGLVVTAVPAREIPFDVLVGRDPVTLDQLEPGSRIGTSSLRRRAQLLYHRPDLIISDVRGNVDTRIRKLDEGNYTGLVLARAGLARLGMLDRVSQTLGPPLLYPAPGQGALGLEVRADDQHVRESLRPLDDFRTRLAVGAERQLLATLRGGCQAPIGTWARFAELGDTLILDAVVLSADGQTLITTQVTSADWPIEQLGKRGADILVERGAAELLPRPA